VGGQSGCRQEGERASEGGGGEQVRETVHGYVDEGERNGDQGQPGQGRQFPGRGRAGGGDGEREPGCGLGCERVRADAGLAGWAPPGQG
jgi:hypothetical protein